MARSTRKLTRDRSCVSPEATYPTKQARQLTQSGVGVEKVTSISRMRFSGSMLEEGDSAHALLDPNRRRPAAYDGATRPFRERNPSWIHRQNDAKKSRPDIGWPAWLNSSTLVWLRLVRKQR
jgi:hypothetical protein